MSDTIEPKAADTTKDQTPEVDVKALAEQLEQIKKAQAGSDKAYQESARKVAELAAENEKLKKEKMSEKERAEFEFAKQKAELEAKSREVAEATSRLSKVRLMAEKGLDPEWLDDVRGSTDEEIAQSIDTIIKRLEKSVSVRVEEKFKGSPKPQAGIVPPKADNLINLSLRDIDRLAREGKL